MGRCSWATRVLGRHPGCPLLRAQTELRCSNAAESELEYMPPTDDFSQSTAQHTLSVDRAEDQPALAKYRAALMPGYAEMARQEAGGHVRLCRFCQEALQKDARIHSPLSLLSLGFRKLEDAATTADAYGQKAALAGQVLTTLGAATLGQTLSKSGKLMTETSKQVSPTLRVTGALDNKLQTGLGMLGVDAAKHPLAGMASSFLTHNISSSAVDLAKRKLGLSSSDAV